LVRLFMVGLCCLLFLTSCGVTPPVVKIGLVAPYEGRYRTVGYDVVWAVRMAVRERNAAGGAGGYAVEVVSLDDGGDPAAAAEQARKLTLDPAVVAVIGHWRDDTTLAALPVYAEAGIPLVAAGVGAPELAQRSRGAFRLYPPDSALEQAALNYVSSTLGSEPLLVHSSANLVQVIEAQPQAVFLDLDLVPAANAVAGLAERGLQTTWVGDTRLADAQYPAIAGAAAEGTIIALGAPLPEDLPEYGDFSARYLAVAGAAPGWRAPLAYDAANVLFETIAQAAANEPPSREAVMAALRSVRYEGLVGPISFDEHGAWREAQVYIYRIEDGRLRRVAGPSALP
jgi:branched-chain amino acid transport system substrate-binding protein